MIINRLREDFINQSPVTSYYTPDREMMMIARISIQFARGAPVHEATFNSCENEISLYDRDGNRLRPREAANETRAPVQE